MKFFNQMVERFTALYEYPKCYFSNQGMQTKCLSLKVEDPSSFVGFNVSSESGKIILRLPDSRLGIATDMSKTKLLLYRVLLPL